MLLLALLALFQVVSASARTATVRPGATIPGTSFTWVSTTSGGAEGYAADSANDVAFLQDGRVAATGTVQLANGQQAFAVAVFRTDGALDWLRTVTGTATTYGDAGLNVAVDPTGNVVAVGYVNDALTRTSETPRSARKGLGTKGGPVEFPRTSILAISYTPAGVERWRRQLNPADDQSAFPNDLSIDSVGNVLIVGGMSNFESGTDFYVAKLLGSDGFVSWEKLFDGGGSDEGLAVAWSPSANAGQQDDVIATGYTSDFEGPQQTVVYKIDGDLGAFNHWVEPILRSNEPTEGYGADVIVDAAGDVIVAGATQAGEGSQFTVAKLAGTDGDTVWTHVEPGNSANQNDVAGSVALGPNGELAAGGYVLDPENGYDYFLTRIDPQSGNEIWDRQIHGAQFDRVADLAFDPQSGIVTAAQFQAGKTGSQTFDVYRHDVDGNQTWHRTATGDGPGQDQAEAVAVDAFGNVAAAGVLGSEESGPDFAVTYVDCQAPTLRDPFLSTSVLPASGGDVLTKVKASDNVGVDTVELVVTNPGGNETRFAMTPGMPGEYEKLLSLPANMTGSPQVYKLLFSAKDATGNVTNLLAGNVTVNPADLSPPTLANCQLSPTTLPAGGGNVTVSAQAVDDVAVASVEAVVTRPDETTFIVPMTLVSGSQYSGTISLPANPGSTERSYSVKLVARDTSNNTDTEDCGNVTVSAGDNQAPVVVSCELNPTTLPFSGGTVTVSAVVTDNVGVTSVIAIVNPPSGPANNVTLVRGSGDSWSGTFNVVGNTGTAPANYGVRIQADDAAGNRETVVCDTVTVEGRDVTPPVITNPQLLPASLPSDGGTVVIRATVTDARGVASVTAKVYLGPIPGSARPRPRGGITPTPVVVALANIGGNLYEGTFTAPANEGKSVQTYNVLIEATDTSGNSSSIAAGSFTVAAFGPGRLQLSTNLVNFGLVNVNSARRKTFRIKNIGKGILTGEMSFPSTPFQAFIKEGKDRTSPNGKGKGLLFALDPGEVITVQVEFAPTAHGRYASEIRVTTNDPTKKKPSRVILKGLGCRVR